MSTTKMPAAALIVLLIIGCVESFIVPEELPTILSIIYSNIPPIKKGTDSRVGVGFRLGDHSDFQVLLEIGPQKETEPIGNAVDSKRKRAAIMSSALKGELGPWAQAVAKHQIERRFKTMLENYKLSNAETQKIKNKNEKSDSQTTASEWLSKWSQGVVVNQDDPPVVSSIPITQKVLPNINRLRVVNSQSSSENQKDSSAQTDLENLKKIFGESVNKTNIVD